MKALNYLIKQKKQSKKIQFLCWCNFIVSFFFISSTLNAQDASLLREAKRLDSLYQVKLVETKRIANERGLKMELDLGNGKKATLVDFENGNPVYESTMNEDAMESISTDEVKSGGAAGLNLSGDGVNLGIWDGGAVRTTHQEFGGRADQIDNPGSTNWHATHVAGTMIAAGVQNNAEGMAHEADLECHDWNNDLSEMATAAAGSNPIVVSNHSYGRIVGWYRNNDDDWVWSGDAGVSSTEDWRFGAYSSLTRSWDNLANNAPNLLIVKAAGNDRADVGDGSIPADGGATGYDCIGPRGSAKNVLTVGSVHDVFGGYSGPASVQMKFGE